MKRFLSMFLMLSLIVFSAIGLSGCTDDYDDTSTDSGYDSDYSGSSGSSSGSYSGSSSGGSSLENYDYDNDGEINDQEFQDATNDYMDDYYGTDSNDLSTYDYNGNGDMETYEFQDAVGDYMDDNGY